MVENHLTALQLLTEHLDRPLGEEVARINEDGDTIHAKFYLQNQMEAPEGTS